MGHEDDTMKPFSLLSWDMTLCVAVAALFLSPGLGVMPGTASQTGSTDGYENISVEEAWGMLNDTADGVQVPIDVRTTPEWTDQRIDTPYPEFPRHFSLSTLSSDAGMNEFKSRYAGEEVIVYCRSGGRSSSASQLLVDKGFDGTIYNMEGGILAWQSAGNPTKTGDEPPAVPQQPDGPEQVHAGYPVTYSTAANDPDGDPLRYGWDWDGDGTVDEWTAYRRSGETATISHTWTTAGSYQVRVKSEDNGGDTSGFSSMLTVTVDDEGNTPPAQPVIEGPTRGKVGEQHTYTFNVNDPDGDQVYIWVEWGGGCPAVQWLGPYDSGDTITLTNTWNDTGTYTVKAKAKDIYDEQSDWSTLEVTMPLSHGHHGSWNLWKYITGWFARITGKELLLPPFLS